MYIYIYKCILLNWDTTEQERQAWKLLGKINVISMDLCWQCAKVSGVKRTGEIGNVMGWAEGNGLPVLQGVGDTGGSCTVLLLGHGCHRFSKADQFPARLCTAMLVRPAVLPANSTCRLEMEFNYISPGSSSAHY